MKTIRFQLLHRTVQFATIISVICCIGCADFIDDVLNDIDKPSNGDDNDVDNQSIIADMLIGNIEVLLAESDPVQVTVVVNGWLPDSCTEHHETHQTQEGNTITIQITTIRPKDFACATIATGYQERVFIGALPAGDYTVIVNDAEQQFRVDDVLNDIDEPSNGDDNDIDNQSIIADMLIENIEVLLAESDPVQVTVVVNGWLPNNCTEHHETHQTQEGNTITIQITTIHPKDLFCATVVTKYQEKVFIGALPAGDYTVIVNDVEQQFRVD